MKQTRRNTEDDRLHFAVYGNVQGVGFRYFIRSAARRLDLCGYVLNRPDGAVEIEASGSTPDLEALRLAARTGPPLARIEAATILDPTAEALPHPFEIRASP